MSEQLLIVGGVAAGTKAAATARRRNAAAGIVVVQDEPDISYSACGLPYHIADPAAIPRRSLIARSVEEFRRDGVDMRVGHRVLGIDVRAMRVTVLERASGRQYLEPFDRLLVATGARPIEPPIDATADAVATFHLRTLTDADAIAGRLASIRDVVILGSGYIGLEAAEAFVLRGHRVTIVEAKERVIPAFSEPIGFLAAARLQAHDVRVLCGQGVERFERDTVVLANGERLKADLVLIAAGVRPVVDLARAAGVEIGSTGAIAVDDHMRTSIPGVFAAGDCVESVHRVSGRTVWLPLGDVANRHGRVAGTNMAGGDSSFPGVLGTAIFSVFGLGVGTTGLDEQQASDAGFDPVVEFLEVPSRARYMPESRPLHVRMVADRRSGRVLGCEVAGMDAVDKAVDTVAAALHGELTVDDLADLDLAYAPGFAPVSAAVQVAGELLRKRAGRR